jgi:hypothetical protein
MDRIRAERQRLRSFPNSEECNNVKNGNSGIAESNIESNYRNIESKKIENIKDVISDNKNTIKKLKEIGGIDQLLSELKNDEPGSDDQLFRMSIIAYELGDLHRAIVYANRFRDDEKMRLAYMANGKLALADVLTQLYLLCVSLEWDFNKLRELGALHLKERHEDFKRDGWSEVK